MWMITLWACGPGGVLPVTDDAPVDSVDTDGPGDGVDGTGADTDTDTDTDGAPAPSRCEVTELTLTCDHHTATLFTGFSGLLPREVHWQVPMGEPPPDGWPAVILFQGSLFTAELFWVVLDTDVFGYWNQGLLTKNLLDSGYAVLTPEAHAGGSTFWDTNVPPMSLFWETSEDHQFMLDIFDAIDDGTFGDLDPGLYAAGISSGGYMTSRMDLEYRSRFRALAIESASYATCSGPICFIPDDLSPAHRPTLFLHGSEDNIVPLWTMDAYNDALVDIGVETERIVQQGAGHAWIDAAPTAIVDWFDRHR
jgi:dienelactone hydrolase